MTTSPNVASRQSIVLLQKPVVHRPRHQTWQDANKLARKPSLSYQEAWGNKRELVRLGREYASDVKDKGIVLREKDGERVLVIPYYTRFSDGFYDRVVKRLRRLITFDSAIFLTLTLDPKRFSSLMDATNELTKGWNKLLSAWRHNKDSIPGWTGSFIRSVEFQESGNPHLHVILLGAKWVDLIWLRDKWENRYGLGTFVRSEKISNNHRKVIRYITAYLMGYKGRELVNRDQFDTSRFVHLALLWSTDKRAYAMSHSIFNVSKTNSNIRVVLWEYLGVFPLSLCQKWSTYSEYRSRILTYLEG